MIVIKRDGTKVDYDKKKIYNAISAAFLDVYGDYDPNDILKLVSAVELDCQGKEEMTVEEIQQKVMIKLSNYGYHEVCLRYAQYKYEHDYLRLMEGIAGILDTTNDEVLNENSNKNGILSSTQRDLMAGEISKELTFKKYLPRDVSLGHKTGEIHFHDGDYFAQKIHNCQLTNIQDMLDNGTVVNKKKIKSPKTFEKACNIMTQIIANCCGGMYGGQSVSLMHLGKYLWKSHQKLLSKDMSPTQVEEDLAEICKNGIQTMLYQLNTFNTTCGQTPFITIFMHLPKDHEYYNYLLMIYEELISQMEEGIEDEYGRKVTLSFPKMIYILDENNRVFGTGEGSELTRHAGRCAAKRMNPDFMSAKKLKEIHGDIYSTMGCRSLLSYWEDENGNPKFEGRFNMGVVTLNLPRVALDAGRDIEKFWELLDERAELCKRALMCRYERLSTATSDISPIHFQHGAIARLNPGESIKPLLEGGYATISLGYIGVYETVMALTGESHTKHKELALNILRFLADKCESWKKETGLGFGLYGTPAEKTCETLCNKDRAIYGIVEGVTDKGYYTNSYHVDVREEIGAFEKLEFESDFQEISKGGAISYVELGDVTNNYESIFEIMDYIYNNIVYAEFNVKFHSCANCGFEGTMAIDDNLEWYCPHCGCKDRTKLHVPMRTCGYIGSNFWCKGKTAEMKQRVEHVNVADEEGIIEYDTSNGHGLRTSVWFKGCPHKCPGCHNQHLWEHDDNFHIDIDRVIELAKETKKVSILGGEPLAPYNIEECYELCSRLRKEVEDVEIFLWTGYEIEELNDCKVIPLLDRVTVGRFIQDLLVNGQEFGSSNQGHIYPRQ